MRGRWWTGGCGWRTSSRLNRVFIVTAEGDRSLILKIARHSGSTGVAREAAVLERLWSRDEVALGAFLPKVIEHDQAQGVLILEATPGGRDLARQHRGGRFSRVLAGQAGGALARLHESPPDVLHGLPGAADPTLALRPHEPDWEFTCEMSSAAEELTRIIQGEATIGVSALDELVGWWQEDW